MITTSIYRDGKSVLVTTDKYKFVVDSISEKCDLYNSAKIEEQYKIDPTLSKEIKKHTRKLALDSCKADRNLLHSLHPIVFIL